jgi:hypothetical protein
MALATCSARLSSRRFAARFNRSPGNPTAVAKSAFLMHPLHHDPRIRPQAPLEQHWTVHASTIRTFHDAILGGGSLPLDVLDARITRWIAAQAAAPVKP